MNDIRGIVSVFVLLLTARCTLAQCNGQVHPQLTRYDKVHFIEGFYGNRSEIYAQVLSQKGCESQMIRALRDFGGTIRYADEKLGYALVLLPREKYLAALDVPGIEYAYAATDGRNYPDQSVSGEAKAVEKARLTSVPGIALPRPRVATELHLNGPYFAAREIELDTFWQKNPTADGRGVGAAVLDSGLDLLHPALQQARRADGSIVPKVKDEVLLATPEESDEWVQLGDSFRTQNGTFEASGRMWTAPKDGDYRFGFYRRELILGPEGNSHTKKLELVVGVLMSEATHQVWVDTNGDGSFQDQRALGDFAATHDIDWFGAKSEDADNRIPFGVKIDIRRHAVFLTIAEDGHGAGIAGSLAANRLNGGLYDGVAPNAQLIDARVTRLTQLPAILQMAAREDVGVLSRSGGFARTGFDGLREGVEDFQRQVANRMAAVYGKPMACVCAARGLISVDDYTSGEMLRRNRQTSGPYIDTMNGFYGAWRSWALVNNVFAPSSQLNTESRYMPFSIVFPDGRRHTFEDKTLDSPAPSGYWIGANESPTVPVVSGILADLISEASREHVGYNAERLYQAIFASARILDDIPMYVQGYGLVQAEAAWDQLAKMAKADDLANSELTSFRFSHVVGGRSEEIDGYYHEVSAPGGVHADEIWVTRHGGFAAGRPYSLALRGDAKEFSLDSTRVTLVRDKPQRIRFKARLTPGFHVVFVALTDIATGAVMQQVPLSVKVPDVGQPFGPGTELYSATMAPRRADTRLIYLDSNVQAARFAAQIPYQGPEGISGRYFPGRLSNAGSPKPPGEPVDAEHHVGPIESFESLVKNNEAGFQYVIWQNRSFAAEYETPYDPPAATVPIIGTVKVTKYALAVRKGEGNNLIAKNRLADIEGKIELYDAKLMASQTKGEGAHATVEAERTLPPHLNQWRVAVSSDSLPADSADAFLLNCTDKKHGCSVAAVGSIGKTGATLVADDPEEGDWRIVIRTRDRFDKAVEYSVREAMLTPSATPIETADAKHPSGSTWLVTLPPKQSDAQYAAFRIAGHISSVVTQNGGAQNGVRIALTPLDSNAP